MDSLQAAVLRAKLGHLELWNRRRQELASRYDDALADARRVRLPARAEDEADVCHLYVIEHPQRDRLRARLAELGAETAIHYPVTLHRQPLFRRLRDQPECPVAERAARVLSLPLYPQLGEAEADEVADAVLATER